MPGKEKVLSPAKIRDFIKLEEDLNACRACNLCEKSEHKVFSDGDKLTMLCHKRLRKMLLKQRLSMPLLS